MKLDAQISPDTPLAAVPEIARSAEQAGFDCLWTAETQHNPFLPGVMAAEHTRQLKFGTAIAVSFARSPAVMAQTAWDLAELSRGRFILGLGTQVRAHITRRFGMPWPDSVVGKLREQIAVMRAFWSAWQHGTPLAFEGQYYTIDLTSPFFTPAPHDFYDIPIYLAGVNPGLARLAGETAQGFHTHPFHSADYLRTVIMPPIEAGTARAGRSRQDVQVVVHAFVATNPGEETMVRQQLAFYASTPSYRPVLAHHGWETLGTQLSALARAGDWAGMPSIIPDEMVQACATVAPLEDLAAALQARYAGTADRINLYLPYLPGQRDAFWEQLCREFNQ